MSELSRTDIRILQVLQNDARLTNVELAERVGMSASPCLRRVRQLEAKGVIGAYVALLDRRALGLDIMAFVEVHIDRHNDKAVEAFAGAVMKEPEVAACYALTGAFDYLIQVIAPNLDAYAEFTMNRLLRMPGVKDVRSSFVLQSVKQSTALPLRHLSPAA
jgi:Lrp/AsnC family leucine-responsive transcriptional regulator